MITARDRIVAREAVHHKTVRRIRVQLDRQRAILGAVVWTRAQQLSIGNVAAERALQCLQIHGDHASSISARRVAKLRNARATAVADQLRESARPI